MTESSGAGKPAKSDASDYSQTLFLPRTDFPMRAGLPQREPEILSRWEKIDLYSRLRESARDRTKFILHDGPPYANGNIHIGHALNKILKDMVTRSQQMLGFDSNYVPGWDCHGLPIEWKIEEENYRSKGKAKPDLSDPAAMIAFRRECRAYAEHWLCVQREEFKRLGVEGDWKNPYTTMAYRAEAQIAREIMKFAENGLLYRGSKPVMWSVVEKTALAEAEIEYEDYTSDTVWVKFPVTQAAFDSTRDPGLAAAFAAVSSASLVIWTTTPWTLPGNRAISFSSRIAYGLYQVTDAPADNWAKTGDRFVLADALAADVFKQARVAAFEKVTDVPATVLSKLLCHHPLRPSDDWGGGAVDGLFLGHDFVEPGRPYSFAVPLLDGEHVTADTGTGFVHTAPSHGREDFDIWMANKAALEARGIATHIPYTVDGDGCFTDHAPGFGPRDTGGKPKCVITAKGEKGDANDAVIKTLVERGMLIACGRLKHQYPHSWRSKKPVIFRNTPQWFIAMDKPIADASGKPDAAGFIAMDKPIAGRDETLRAIALREIANTRWVPPQGENRIRGMIESRPDWVISRQRAWGVPIAVFARETVSGEVEILKDDAVNARIIDAFRADGADAWYAAGARERFLGSRANEGWRKVDDILDVWFDSGSTHAFVLEDPVAFPGLAGIRRSLNDGSDKVMYLEGSDQHRGWFHSSLLESCGTRGVAPYDVVLTHGFTLDEQGRKMSKSLGNQTFPQDVIKQAGADILRLWVASVDYSDDQRIGPEILKSVTENYRKLRNTLRWMLGSLAHFHEEDEVPHARMPELERLMLHRLAEIEPLVRRAYADFDYKRVFTALNTFMISDLSAFYFDIRKDVLYCDPYSSVARKAALTVIDQLFRCTVTWLAPLLCFTAEEAWLSRFPSEDGSVHLELLAEAAAEWRDDALAAKWRTIRNVRRVVTGALEVARARKLIGSSLEAAPVIYVTDDAVFEALAGIDLAEICITSAASLHDEPAPADAFRLDDVADVAVSVHRAEGTKCARSWKILASVGEDPAFPDVSPRDAEALREWRAMNTAPQ
jgi:isoleucyl-tRNA synthetase